MNLILEDNMNNIVDVNGICIKNGSIFDIHQTVNGEHLFVMLDVATLDVRYACDITYKYEYSVNELFEAAIETDEPIFEIVGNIHEHFTSIRSNTILMGRDNHTGWKLEDILQKLVEEITAKSELISDASHAQKDMIIGHNSNIIELLTKAKSIQVDTYKQLDAVEPNRGPASPRL